MATQVQEIEERLRAAGYNLLKLGAIIGEFKVNHDGIVTPEQAREVIISHIENIKGKQCCNSENLEKRTEKLLSSLRKEREKQLQCVELFQKAMEEVVHQSKFIKCSLQLQCRDFENEMLKRKRSLELGNVRILITGEICAGKSSILNMLMGGSYMPVGHGPCTVIPCEIKQSKERKAALCYTDTRYSTREIQLVIDENDPVWSQVRACVETGQDRLQDKEQRTNERLEKIIVYWNMQILNNVHETQVKGVHNIPDSAREHEKVIDGITFVDVPGIHDTDQTFSNMCDYIEDCDAFLFVINTSQHAGVDRDRLMRLMADAERSFQRKHGIFIPRCAFFICNKWDYVDSDIRASLKKEILTKLQNVWSRVAEEQMVTFSGSEQMLDCVRQRYYSEEYVSFFNNICDFVETAAHLKTEAHCWWLSTITDRTLAIVSNMQDIIQKYKTNKEKVLAQIQKDIDDITIVQEERDNIDKKLTETINANIKKMHKYLQTDLKESKNKLAIWHISKIPVQQENENWHKFSSKIDEAVGLRIENHILGNSHIQSIRNQCSAEVDSNLNHLIMQYAELEKKLTFKQQIRDDKLNNLIELMSDSVSDLTWEEIAGAIVAVVFPLAPIVVFLIDAIDSVRTPKMLYDENLFQKDCYRYMTRQTEILIENILTSRLQRVSKALLDGQIKNSEFVLKYFHTCLKMQREMLQELSDEIQNSKLEVRRTTQLQQLSDEIQNFLIGKVLRLEIDKDLIQCEKCPSDHLGRGAFGNVYTGIFLGNIENRKVAIKVIHWPRGRDMYPDDTFIYRECFNLRMLSVKPEKLRKNVVDYYGEFVEVSPSIYSLHIVMELCNGSLDSLIEKCNLSVPWCKDMIVDFPGRDQSQKEGAGYIIHLAEQAAMGIQFLHDNNIVHRDIKPHNFLIKHLHGETRVKICDFGLSRDQNLIKTTRCVGTITYNAPEVLAGNLNTFASDIYSLGLVVWELWYGERVFQNLTPVEVRNPNRNAPKLKEFQPSPFLKTLMLSMWKRNEDERPDVTTIVSQLKQLRRCYKTFPKPTTS